MSTMGATDFTTYPGDRPTRHTPAQRTAKVARARSLLAEAEGLLADVCDDFGANSYRLTEAHRNEWRRVANAADAATTGHRELRGM